jgi:hypothetical protein
MRSKPELFSAGVELMERFCRANNISIPEIVESSRPHDVGTCAYYRESTITIHVKSCSSIGLAGASWSFPGYFIDRTPYGVIQHELGHHVDCLFGNAAGAYYSDFSVRLHGESGEEKLTNYCPNRAEWFAEMFRLFVTNPSLLEMLRPKTFALISARLVPVEERAWFNVLEHAPKRAIDQCLKRAGAAARARFADSQPELLGGAK